MKFQILIEMIYMLLARKKVTARQIADRFGISLRSVYRYFQDIELANVPILVDKGKDGGFYIADTFKMPGSFLTENELQTLSRLIDAVVNDANEKELNHIKDKLFASTKNSSSLHLASTSLIIDGGDWFNTQSYKNKLALISDSILKHLTLNITYHDRNGEKTTRVIEPHALILKQGLWYVYSYCRLRERFRTFKIGRIETAVSGEEFQPKNFDKQSIFDAWKQEKTEDYVFELDLSIKSDVEEWLGIECVRELPCGKIIAECTLPSDKGQIYNIMKYGSKLKVVQPEYIKKQIKKEAEKIYNLYK
ncbi:MAG: helix-turn-helix transcriptional regulator [Christensenellaceae bacterium]